MSNASAVAVWTRCMLTHDQVSAADPQTIAGLNAILNNQNIEFAVWSPGGGWGPPVQLVADSVPALIPDGRPRVAPVPSVVVDGAWVVWVRHDSPDLVQPDNTVRNSSASIYARRIAGGAPSGPAFKVSAGDEAAPKYDLQPAIAVSPSGNVALAVWVRDDDGNLDSSTDRYLMYSVKPGPNPWSAPAAVTSPMTLPGAESPSAALSDDTNGMIVFTSREVTEQGQIAAWGNKNFVYAIRILDTVFQPARRLERLPHVRRGRVHGLNPIVRFLNPTHAAVVFRDFDGFGRAGGDGELALATIDLAQPTPKWGFVRDLTSDTDRDWEIAAAVAPDGRIRTIRDSASGPASLDGLVLTDVQTMTRDLAVDAIRVADPRTPAGHPVTLTAVIRNDGLQTPGTTPPSNTVVRFGQVINDMFVEFDAVPFVLTAPPDGTQTVARTIWMPVSSGRYRVIADPLIGESDLADNSADAVLGVLPPANLGCSDAVVGTRRAVELGWTNGELYDSISIYRNGHLIRRLPGDAESFVDAFVAAGTHVWSLSGRVARTASDPAAAQCLHSVPVLGDLDGDGDVDEIDGVLFVGVLLGTNTNPDHVARSDLNLDGVEDGDDIPVFVAVRMGA